MGWRNIENNVKSKEICKWEETLSAGYVVLSEVISLWKVHNLKVLKFGKVKILIIILLLFKKNTFILSFFKPKILSFFNIERCFHKVKKKKKRLLNLLTHFIYLI